MPWKNSVWFFDSSVWKISRRARREWNHTLTFHSCRPTSSPKSHIRPQMKLIFVQFFPRFGIERAVHTWQSFINQSITLLCLKASWKKWHRRTVDLFKSKEKLLWRRVMRASIFRQQFLEKFQSLSDMKEKYQKLWRRLSGKYIQWPKKVFKLLVQKSFRDTLYVSHRTVWNFISTVTKHDCSNYVGRFWSKIFTEAIKHLLQTRTL